MIFAGHWIWAHLYLKCGSSGHEAILYRHGDGNLSIIDSFVNCRGVTERPLPEDTFLEMWSVILDESANREPNYKRKAYFEALFLPPTGFWDGESASGWISCLQ